MKKNYVKIFAFLMISFLLFSTNIFSQNNAEMLAKKVANKYGLQNFSKVKSIRFTFNVKAGKKILSRKWYWEPETQKVVYQGPNKDGKIMDYSYYENNVDKNDSVMTMVDAKFINDQYWLLFPFHLIWDKKAELQDKGNQPYPISKKPSHCLIVKYPPSAGGYTPGDIFELYIGKDNLIHEWIYRAGGKKDGRILTWEDYKNFNGLNISTIHYSTDKNFKLWFSGIKVTLK